jgi:hypothetical protein
MVKNPSLEYLRGRLAAAQWDLEFTSNYSMMRGIAGPTTGQQG